MNFTKWLKINRGLSDNTIKTYIKIVASYENFNVNNVVNKKLGHNTKRLHIFAGIAYYDWKIYMKKTENNPFRVINKPKIIKGKRKYISESEYQMLMNAYIDDNLKRGVFTKQAISLMFYLGLRSSELLNINKNNIKEEIIYIFGKGGKTRNIPIPKSLQKIYGPNLERIDFATLNSYTYSSLRKNILKASKIALGKNYSPHSFRHGYATMLLQKGIDLYTISKLLGHSSLNTTAEYLHMNPRLLKEKIGVI